MDPWSQLEYSSTHVVVDVVLLPGWCYNIKSLGVGLLRPENVLTVEVSKYSQITVMFQNDRDNLISEELFLDDNQSEWRV